MFDVTDVLRAARVFPRPRGALPWHYARGAHDAEEAPASEAPDEARHDLLPRAHGAPAAKNESVHWHTDIHMNREQ